MISCRQQILNTLLAVCDNVKTERPEGELSLPLITYGEVTNTTVSRYVDQIEYQIDAYAASFADMIQLTRAIDEKMDELGWRRTYVTPDSRARVGTGLYQKAISYVARIDTRIKNIINE